MSRFPAVYRSQLRRYRRGNKEPFVEHLSGLGESCVSLGAAFPATYYQPVRVCNNCYRVYSMVDAARTKSVRRLDARAAAASSTGPVEDRGDHHKHGRGQRAAKRARGETRATDEGDPRTRGSISEQQASTRPQGLQTLKYDGAASAVPPHAALTTVASALNAEQTRILRKQGWDVEDAAELGCDTAGGSQESVALKRAQAAIDSLTRTDICELRSFSKPPAAVNMVAAALMIALTGNGEPNATGWLTAKRFMINVDRLFAAVTGLDLDTIRVSQVRKLEAYARNPAFRPGIIACVSLPASKICAWVLGILVRGEGGWLACNAFVEFFTTRA